MGTRLENPLVVPTGETLKVLQNPRATQNPFRNEEHQMIRFSFREFICKYLSGEYNLLCEKVIRGAKSFGINRKSNKWLVILFFPFQRKVIKLLSVTWKRCMILGSALKVHVGNICCRRVFPSDGSSASCGRIFSFIKLLKRKTAPACHIMSIYIPKYISAIILAMPHFISPPFITCSREKCCSIFSVSRFIQVITRVHVIYAVSEKLTLSLASSVVISRPSISRSVISLGSARKRSSLHVLLFMLQKSAMISSICRACSACGCRR